MKTRSLFLILIIFLCSNITFGQKIEGSKLISIGIGEVSLPADQVKFTVPINVEGSSLVQTIDITRSKISDLVKVFQNFGINSEDIETPRFSNMRNYDASFFTSKKDFKTSLSVYVTIKNLNVLDSILIKLAEMKYEPYDFSFSLKNEDTIKILAVEKAVEQAIAKAKAISKVSGISLGSIVYIEELLKKESEDYTLVAERTLHIRGGIVTPTIYPQKIIHQASVKVVYNINN